MSMDTEGFSYELLDSFGLPRPDGWERIEAPGGMLAVAHPPVPAGTFRPNMVLRWAPAARASVARYATAALASTLEQFEDVRIVSHDLWESTADGTSVTGRRQRFVHQVGPHPVCVDRWIWLAGGYALEATASYTVDQHIGMKLLFEHMVADIRIDGSVPEGGLYSGQQPELDRIAPQEPRRDEFASRWMGADVEDLAGISGAQPYRESGDVFSIASLELLDTLADRTRLGRFQRKDAAALELQSAGLLTADGTLTSAGEQFLTPTRGNDAAFLIEASGAAGGSVMQAWIGGGLAKVTTAPSLFSASLPSDAELGSDELFVRLTQANAVPKLIADWAGLSPAWSLPHQALILPKKHYLDRLEDARTIAPKDLDEAGTRMWEQPWTQWEVLEERTGAWFGWVNAGSAGQYRLTPGPGENVRLEPMPSDVVWDVLVRFIHASVEGIPLMLPELPDFSTNG
ncbi:hypothetical protein [Arthrobacter sp. zg-Y238]|uniref:hypothetical protein n=1 Tax=Arthrobacter sp. zg-Y238 TaxID=2964614 RepID=UPI0021050477|nr:hypothetical protein [Arthrobacter sp. zg-Y238]MCQ1952653.1 hypothetical protein [Arthrobacter sp. zg-Y238]